MRPHCYIKLRIRILSLMSEPNESTLSHENVSQSQVDSFLSRVDSTDLFNILSQSR